MGLLGCHLMFLKIVISMFWRYAMILFGFFANI
jgi:hypothetical protein